jgi:hypothetical protein
MPSRKSPLKLIWIGTSILLLLSIGGFFFTRPNLIARYSSRPAVLVTARGGMCANGPCEHPQLTLYENGSYEGHSALSADDVRRITIDLVTLSNTQTAVNSQAQGDCASYADGTDVVWKLAGTDREIIPCTYTDPASIQIINRLQDLL